MYLDPTLALTRSHTDDLRAAATNYRLARLAQLAGGCRSSRAAIAGRSVTASAARSLRQVGPRTLHWLRAGQLQAPCGC